MVCYKFAVIFIICVLQMCTANPITSDPALNHMLDEEQIFSNDQIEMAKNVGLTERKLVEGKRNGFTFDETLKFHQLLRSIAPMSRENVTFEFMTKICDILDSEHKTATSYTDDQETHLRDLVVPTTVLLHHDQASYTRTTPCDYISQPDVLDSEANSFGLEFVQYMELRYFKLSAQKGTDIKRVRVAKDMCCIHNYQDKKIFVMPSEFEGFSQDVLNAFDRHWNEFVESNTLTSFENVCDFLHTKNPDDVCVLAFPFDKHEKAFVASLTVY